MKALDAIHCQSASELITEKIASLGDWRGETLARMRKLILEAVSYTHLTLPTSDLV